MRTINPSTIPGLKPGVCCYKKASVELKKEAGELRDLNNIMLCAMEALNWIELETDKEGKISGFKALIKLKDQTIALPVIVK